MIIKRQYLDNEKSNGFIMTKVLNPSYANDTIPFDVFEAVHNPGESGALFIPTRVMVTRNQGQKGSCENPGYPCDSDEDCDTGDDMSTGKCSNSMCVRRGWCPSETVRTPGTEVYKIDASSYDLWFQGRVLYHKFRADVGNTEDPSPISGRTARSSLFPRSSTAICRRIPARPRSSPSRWTRLPASTSSTRTTTRRVASGSATRTGFTEYV